MLTFLFPPDDKDTSFQSFLSEIEAFFRKDKALPEGMEELYRILKRHFPLEYIMATVATDRQGAERMFMFPEIAGMRKVALNSTPEQLLALGHGPERVVRLGNQDDHGITLGVIHRLFPSVALRRSSSAPWWPDASFFPFRSSIPNTAAQAFFRPGT